MLDSNNGFGFRLNEFFDKIYCINLDSRPDRWRYVKDHFTRFGLQGKVERFPAIDIRNEPNLMRFETLQKNNFSHLANCGCTLSHRKIVEYAKNAGLENVLVFEDDVKLLADNIANIDKSLFDLGELDWDVFYLGATYLWRLNPVGSHLVSVSNGAFATHAIAYNRSVFDRILASIPGDPLEYLQSDRFEVNAVDKWLQSDSFDQRKFFGTNPMMAVQGLQESDISTKQPADIEKLQMTLFSNNLKH